MYPQKQSVKKEQAIAKLLKRKLFSMAQERLYAAIEEDPKSISLRLLLADTCRESLDFNTARSILEELRQERPDDDVILRKLPAVLLGAGEAARAKIEAQTLIDRSSGSARDRARIVLVDLYERTNSIDQARELFDSIKSDDLHVKMALLFTAGRLQLQEKQYDAAAATFMDYVTQRAEFSDEIQIPPLSEAWFQLAKIHDRQGNFDQAWAAAEEAHRPYAGWDPAAYIAAMEVVPEAMCRAALKPLAHANIELEWSPLFIVGMPRSGTTLLEQILSMHPDISNGGEMSISMRMIQATQQLTDSFLPWPKSLVDLRVDDVNALGQMYMDAVRLFAGKTRIVSNKALTLQTQLGFLSLAVPNARAIMLYRHPLDNAVSCHTTNLVTLGHRFTTDMRTFGKVWVARRKLQEFWLEQLDIPMMELHYESMVQHQDDETRRLLAFLDVAWDPNCLDFHKSSNVARTISYDQVNRKMYSTSDGRWKNYEKHLGPVIDEVGEYL